MATQSELFVADADAEVSALAARFDRLPRLFVELIDALEIATAEKEQVLQKAQEFFRPPGADVEIGDGRRGQLHRRRSAVSVQGVKDAAWELTADLPPKIRDAVLAAADTLDVDGDGEVVPREFGLALVRGAEHAAGKDRASVRQWVLIGALLVVVALLAGSNFFTSDAAVKKNKEMVVDREVVAGLATGAALLTTDLLPVATSVNEIDVALPALAWLTGVVHEFPRYIAFRSGSQKRGDAILRHEEVVGVAVEEEKSVVLTTAMGTKISWHREEDAGVVNFALDDGTLWTKPVGCEACTILNVVMSEEVQRGIEKLHSDLDMVLHREGRVLETGDCTSDKGPSLDPSEIKQDMCRTTPSKMRVREFCRDAYHEECHSPPPPGVTRSPCQWYGLDPKPEWI